jgi:hypothetical protein
MKEIAKYIADAIYRATERISSSGALIRSIKSGTERKGQYEVIYVEANRYFNYVDRGVSGKDRQRPNTPYAYKNKRPPQAALYQYLKNKGVSDKEALKGSWAMQVHIWKNGIEAANILDPTMQSINDEVNRMLADKINGNYKTRINKWL